MDRHDRPEDLVAHRLVVGIRGQDQGGADEEPILVGVLAPGDHLGVGAGRRPVDVAADRIEAPPVDDRAHEVSEVRGIPHPQGVGLRGQVVADLPPHGGGNVGPGRRRALLPLVLEGTAHDRGPERGGVGARMRHDEVFAPRLAHQPRVRPVARDVPPHGRPQRLEDLGRAREVQPGEVRVLHGRRRHSDGIARHEVDHPGRQPRLFQHPVVVVRRQHRVLGRLPEHPASHHRRGAGQVGPDRREVEGADRVDEPLQRPVLEAVPDALLGDGLVVEDALGEVGAEAEEVDRLAGGVDLGLEGGLALAEHGGRVQGGAPRGREQLGGLEEHGGAILPGPRRPFPARVQRVGDRPPGLVGSGFVPHAQAHPVVVRGEEGVGLPGPDLLAPDDDGDVGVLVGDGAQHGLQFGPLGGAGSVGEYGFVDGGGETNRSGHRLFRVPGLAGAAEAVAGHRIAGSHRLAKPWGLAGAGAGGARSSGAVFRLSVWPESHAISRAWGRSATEWCISTLVPCGRGAGSCAPHILPSTDAAQDWRAGEETGIEWSLTETAAVWLRNGDWPGNRELVNVLDYCRLFAQDGFIHRELVEEALESQRIGIERRRSGEMGGLSRPQSDREQREELAEALEATGGDKSKAARLLEIHRRTVYRRLKRLGGKEPLER